MIDAWTLEKRLGESVYLAGDDNRIADIAMFPWVRNPARRGSELDEYPAVGRGAEVLADSQRQGAMTETERENMFGAAQFAAR